MENPVEIIKAFQADPTKWRKQGRGFVDWKFGQVAEYLGYQGALEYVATMQRWWDFEQKYSGCLLNKTFMAFRAAELEKHSTDIKIAIEQL